MFVTDAVIVICKLRYNIDGEAPKSSLDIYMYRTIHRGLWDPLHDLAGKFSVEL